MSAIPDGWVMVPREPSDNMLIAGQEAWAVIKPRRNAIEDCKESEAVYRSMIAASPPAPAVAEPLTEEWIAQFCMDVSLGYSKTEALVRHVEQAHGIGIKGSDRHE